MTEYMIEITKEQVDAIKAIIKYLDEEEEDWRSTGYKPDHIYTQIMKVESMSFMTEEEEDGEEKECATCKYKTICHEAFTTFGCESYEKEEGFHG